MSERNLQKLKVPSGRLSRRDFMKSAAILAASASLHLDKARAATRSGNSLPGRIVIWEDLDASDGSSVDLAVVKQMMDDSLTALTGQADPVSALTSLLPDLDISKKIAIKVNCINSAVPTRWEVVKGITDRLLEMLGGTYPAGNITIFDNRSVNNHYGFTPARFPGMVLATDHSPDPGTLIEVEPGYDVQLSSHIVNCDYLINCPVLKNHGGHRWTLGFKNHIGSVWPVTCHSYEPRLLTLSASPHLKDKTRLVVTSGIHGVWTGGPGGIPGGWLLFPEESTPNLVMLSTDPVTSEHWGIEVINQERALQGSYVYNDIYCQHAAQAPYDLGVYDFAQHEVITTLPASASLNATSGGGGGVLLQWSAVTGASKYRVYRSTNPYFTPDPWGGTNLLIETTSTSYTDPSGAGDPDQNHYYVVRAFRACWESPDSPRAGVFNYSLP